MSAVVTAGVEGLVAVKVVEEGVEPIAIVRAAESAARAKGLVAAKEAEVLVMETRIRMEARAIGTTTAGVRHVQTPMITSATLGN